jgi:thiol-disulfide isomerase/thioredoxin
MQRSGISGLVLAGLLWCGPGTVGADGFIEPYQELTSAPALNLEDIQGTRHDLDDLQGSVVLVNFWASWCPPCVREMPAMRRLADTFRGRDFLILAVNVAEGKAKAARYAQPASDGFLILDDKNSAAFKAWQARVFPSSYILDTKGRLRYRVEGPFEWDSLESIEVIESLLAEP